MINKKELTGNRLKKCLNAHSVGYRWNNKNKGWGNFGINIYFSKEFKRGIDKELTGSYKEIEGEKIINSLTFSDLWGGCGVRVDLNQIDSFDKLIDWIKEGLEDNREEFKEEDNLRAEFEQQLKDDEDFKKQWGEDDGSYKEESFKEWIEVYSNQIKNLKD